MKLSDFDFSLPQESIAQKPVTERDCSRLMIIDRQSGRIRECLFKDITRYIASNDLLVLNNTRVFPARLYGEKAGSGGKIEALLISQTGEGEWLCLIKGKVKIGQLLRFAQSNLSARVLSKEEEGRWQLHFDWEGDFFGLLQRYGSVPLPPYIKRDESCHEDKERYQTVFARHTGAVAVPTAGLHFTDSLLKKISQKGSQIAFVTLHVGPGTFKPVRTRHIEWHRMDGEKYSIAPDDLESISVAKKEGKRIIAVGTTTTRVLETICVDRGFNQASLAGVTNLYITPGFRFKNVDKLITNFHLPQSTPLILVCAFAGYELTMKAYRQAVERGFRFYSYGDAMLIT